MKQVIIVRKDLTLSTGKLIAQCCHGSIEAYKESKKDKKREWKMGGQKKIVVAVDSVENMIKLKKKADDVGLVTSLVKDAGRTEVPAGTKTVLVIGPDKDENVDKITASLPLLD